MLLPIPDPKETGRILATLKQLGRQDPAKAVLRGEAARRLLRGVIQAGAAKAGLSAAEALQLAATNDLAGVPVSVKVIFE